MIGRRFVSRPGAGVRLSLIATVASLVALTACSTPDGPTAPSASPLVPIKAAASISDATQGAGDAHFYWLPPIAPSGTYAGTFDPGLRPEIRICRAATLSCVVPLVTIPPGSITVDPAAKSYSTSWSTSPSSITVDDYRAEVWISGRKMGYADIRVVPKQKDIRAVPTGFAGVVKGNSLTLAFRLEFGIVASISVTPPNTAIDSGATVPLYS